MGVEPASIFMSASGLPTRITQPEPGPLTRTVSAHNQVTEEIQRLQHEIDATFLTLRDTHQIISESNLHAQDAAHSLRHLQQVMNSLTEIQTTLANMERILQATQATIEMLRSDRGQLQSLCVIAEHLNTTLDRPELLDRILNDVVLLLKADRVGIMLIDAHQTLYFEEMLLADGTHSTFPLSSECRILVEQVWQVQKPMLFSLAELESLHQQGCSLLSDGTHCAMCVPLKVQQALIGFVYVDRIQTHDTFSAQHLDLLTAFCNEAAIALQNVNLFATQKLHLQEIAAMKTYTDSILGSISSGVMALDNTGRITHINHALERIMHISLAEVVEMSYEQVFERIADTALLTRMAETLRLPDVFEQYLAHAHYSQPVKSSQTLNISWTALRDTEHRRLGSVVVFDDLTELAQAQHAAQVFRKYVHPDVVDLVTNNPSAAELGGALREISVVFADLTGYTTLGESMPPDALVELLNEYLNHLTKAVFAHGGTVTMFQGDAVMAIFNAPHDQPDHAARAVRAAWAMRTAVEHHNQQTGQRQVSVGIGINTGVALVGNIGARDLLQNYTAIGDVVNSAKRLEEHTKPQQILLSDDTHQRVRGLIQSTPQGELLAKGKSKSMQIWSLDAVLG